MQFNPSVLEAKIRHLDEIHRRPELLEAVLRRLFGDATATATPLPRPWEPGGGASLFRVVHGDDEAFLKVKSLEVLIESKLEGETSFHQIPSIRNEARFLEELAGTSPHFPVMLGYEEQEGMGFLLTEPLASFEKSTAAMEPAGLVRCFGQIEQGARVLYAHGIAHTDIHEKNILFRDDVPVLIDFEEARWLEQPEPFEASLDATGVTSLGDVGEMPTVGGNPGGFTCLDRLRDVFSALIKAKMDGLIARCNFDSTTCPFITALDHGRDERVYQSIRLPGFELVGQRSANDDRAVQIGRLADARLAPGYTHLDIGCNIGNFNISLAANPNVACSIGFEAHEPYVEMASVLAFLAHADKAEFHRFVAGTDRVSNALGTHQVDLITIYSVFHHIPNRHAFLRELADLKPAMVIFELATQRECYEGRTWKEEGKIIADILEVGEMEIIEFSKDYRRPIVAFTRPAAAVVERPDMMPAVTPRLTGGPRVSLVLPTCNHADFLPTAIDSILAQTFQDFELIVVNDGSTDHTKRFLDSLSAPRIKVIHQENKRLPGALNTGFRAAQGELLTWTSSDNYCAPTFLEQLVAALDADPGAGFAYSSFAWIDRNDAILGIHRDQDMSLPSLYSKNPGMASFMYRRTCMEAVGLYDTELEGAEDWDMWMRIVERFPTVQVPDVLYYYRLHGNSMTVEMPTKIHGAAIRAFANAVARAGGAFQLERLYPAIEACRDRRAATFHAHLDLAAKLLASPWFSQQHAELAIASLDAARQIDAAPVVLANLALAYLRAGRGAEAKQLLPQIPAQEPFQHLRAALEAVAAKRKDIQWNPASLAPFRVSTEGVELFEEARRRRLRETQPGVSAQPDTAPARKAVAGVHSERPLVSVLVPTYNRPAFLRRALQSLKAQSYDTLEVIVVNDCGEDVSAVTAEFTDTLNLVHIRHGVNRGLAAARNTALKIARGGIIVYLDDDDVFLPDHIGTVVAALQDPGVDFVYTDAEYVVEKQAGDTWQELGRANPFAGLDYSKARLHYRNFIPVNTWGHRIECVAEVGYFDEQLKVFEDWDFVLRISRRYENVRHITKTTVEVHTRETPDNMLAREQSCFQDTVRLLYGRYDDLGMPETIQGRRQMLGTVSEPGASQPPAEQSPPKDLYALRKERRAVPVYEPELNGQAPTFQLIVNCSGGQGPELADTLDSLGKALLPTWQLDVLSDVPSPNALFDELEILYWEQLADGEPLADALNRRIGQSTADWVVFLEPGTVLFPHFFAALDCYARIYPETRLWYSDSERHDGTAQFRCDFNPNLLCSEYFLGNVIAVARSNLLEIGPLPGAGPVELYDIALKVLDHSGAEAIGHVDEILYKASPPAAFSDEAARGVLLEHLKRQGVSGFIIPGFLEHTHRITYVHDTHPKASIIIATQDPLVLLADCVASILGKATYPDYEIIIVDNQSRQQDALDFLQELETSHTDQVRVLKYAKPFNHAAMRNVGAKAARGEYLLFLDSDTQVLQKEWLHLLMYQAQRPEIGIVGPRLVYPGVPARIQHAGVVLGLGGVADHPYMGLLGLEDPGYMNRAQVDQELSAVCGSCLLIRKSVFEEVGGMDEAVFRNVMSPIDLCLKVREKGYKVLWTPYVTLIHHGSATRNAEAKNVTKAKEAQENLEVEFEGMLKKWLPQLARDPFYNRNLSLLHRDYRVESDFIVPWDPRIPSDRTRILGWTLDGAPCEYRVKIPLRALNDAGATETGIIYPPGPGLIRSVLLTEIVRANPDIFTTSVFLGMHEHIPILKHLKKFTEIPVVMQLDDITTAVPKGSHAYSQRHTPGHLKKLLSFADRVVVTTQPIADYVKGLCGDVMLIPNYLPRSLWDGKVSERRQGKKPRVGWAGAMQHGGDLALITEVVKATADEVDWVFFGMCPEGLAGLVREFYPFGPFDAYPTILASLNLDLAIAPLENNKFNEGKSNLRLLEYGFLGWPVVCSDVLPYRDAPVKRVSDKPSAWIEAIRERVNDLDAAEREGRELQRWVLDGWMLEDHLEEWAKAYSFGV